MVTNDEHSDNKQKGAKKSSPGGNATDGWVLCYTETIKKFHDTR